jgi:glycine/D-amino acid oxidase-like deaminating enzyme
MGHLVVMDDSPEQLALTAYSTQLWNARASELDARSELDPCGTLWLAEDEAQLEAVRAKRESYAAVGVRAEVIDAKALGEAEPNLRRDLAGALYVPGDSVVYPPGVTLRLLELARERGATLREGVEVQEIVPRGVRTQRGTLECDVVINAAGARAPQLTSALPIVPRKGHLAITDRYPRFCRHQLVELGYLTSAHVMTSESVAFNVQPRPTGQVLIGSSRELVGWDPSTNHRVLAQMLRRAVDFIPSLPTLSIIRTWTGFRPATPDKLSLVGRWESTPGLWIAAGHEGLGITTALATGQLIADQLAGRTPAIDPAPYGPLRALESADRGGHP